MQSTTDLGGLKIRLQGLVDGRQDREQKWKECVDVLSTNLPFAIGAAYIEKFFKADTKASIAVMLNNIKAQFATAITEADWIDEGSRGRLLHKLESLVPLIAYPDDGFDEHAIQKLYDNVKIDKNRYLTTLFRLRVIDADDKFRQTYTSTASESWNKYLPPTTVTASYSASDNTLRKTRVYENARRSRIANAVINFDLFSRRTLGWHRAECRCARRSEYKLSSVRCDWIYHGTRN